MIVLLSEQPFAACSNNRCLPSCASRPATVSTPSPKAEVSRPDLIILDLGMPGMNGFDAATVLQKTMPQVPVFMFTSHDRRDVESQAASVGIRAVFSKCTGINALVAQASELLRPSRTSLIQA